jgi:hypothetical protein
LHPRRNFQLHIGSITKGRVRNWTAHKWSAPSAVLKLALAAAFKEQVVFFPFDSLLGKKKR